MMSKFDKKEIVKFGYRFLLRHHSRAKRITMRYCPFECRFTITLPNRASTRQVESFLKQNRDWIDKCVSRATPFHFVEVGSVIPFRGVEYEVVHDMDAGKEPLLQNGKLIVGGARENVAQCLQNWLKTQARCELSTACSHYSKMLGLREAVFSIRDQKTRWGSCSRAGRLSFSWRLIMAPGFVLDYVAAHEVAHRKCFDHSAKFWRLLNEIYPDSAGAKKWLKEKGSSLKRLRFC